MARRRTHSSWFFDGLDAFAELASEAEPDQAEGRSDAPDSAEPFQLLSALQDAATRIITSKHPANKARTSESGFHLLGRWGRGCPPMPTMSPHLRQKRGPGPHTFPSPPHRLQRTTRP
jgi:hypothetical protein